MAWPTGIVAANTVDVRYHMASAQRQLGCLYARRAKCPMDIVHPHCDRFACISLQEGGAEGGEPADDCAGVSRQDRIRFQVTLEEGEGDEEREAEEEDDDDDEAGGSDGDPSGDPTSAAGM